MARFSLSPMNGWAFVAFQPLIDRKTESGFLVPPPKQEGMPNRGVILALADDAKLEYKTLEGEVKKLAVGDFVVYDEHSPDGFKWQGNKIIPVHKDHLLGVELT